MKTVLSPTTDQWSELTARPTTSLDDVMPVVDEVFGAIQRRGDLAIQAYSEKFDGYRPERIEVDLADLKNAKNELSADLRAAIDRAYDNIYAFHKAQQTDRVQLDVQEGVSCWQEKRPIEKVGLYIPGGTAPLCSSLPSSVTCRWRPGPRTPTSDGVPGVSKLGGLSLGSPQRWGCDY